MAWRRVDKARKLLEFKQDEFFGGRSRLGAQAGKSRMEPNGSPGPEVGIRFSTETESGVIMWNIIR